MSCSICESEGTIYYGIFHTKLLYQGSVITRFLNNDLDIAEYLPKIKTYFEEETTDLIKICIQERTDGKVELKGQRIRENSVVDAWIKIWDPWLLIASMKDPEYFQLLISYRDRPY